MPKISVCLTHYERPEKLAVTLESLARQTRIPDELFLWDDCSKNDPSAIVRQWEGCFPHFVYNRNTTNLGMPGNLNAVIAQATGRRRAVAQSDHAGPADQRESPRLDFGPCRRGRSDD